MLSWAFWWNFIKIIWEVFGFENLENAAIETVILVSDKFSANSFICTKVQEELLH